MRSVSILIPIHDNYHVSRLAIESCIKKTGIWDCEIIVFNNGSSDPLVKEWLINLPNTFYCESDVVVRNSEAINQMLKLVTKEYVCIIPIPVFLPENWLLELVQWNASIIGSGITAINTSYEKESLTTKMTEEYENVFVYQNLNNHVAGVLLFKYSIVEQIGGFEPLLNQGFEYSQFCFRTGKLGLSNYYIPKLNSISVGEIETYCFFETSYKEYADNLNKICRTKDFRVKFETSTNTMKEAQKDLPELISKFASVHKKEWYLELSETWGFDLIGISDNEIDYLNQFCKKWNLKFIIFQSVIINRGISIKFFEA